MTANIHKQLLNSQPKTYVFVRLKDVLCCNTDLRINLRIVERFPNYVFMWESFHINNKTKLWDANREG